MSRKDLNDSDKSDIDQIKRDLTDSCEYDDQLDLPHLIEFFNKRSCVSEPTTPSKGLKSRPPVVRNTSLIGLDKIVGIKTKMSDMESELAPLRRRRGGFKGQVTQIVNNVKQLHDAKTLTLSMLSKQEKVLNERINKIFEVEEEISEIYDSYEVLISDEGRLTDSKATLKFITDSQDTFARIEDKLNEIKLKGKVSGADVNTFSKEELVQLLSKQNANPTTVVLSCQDFYGNEEDKLNFGQWLPQLMSVVNANPGWDDAGKLTYLKDKVKGAAKVVIRPITHEHGGFDQAIEALKHQYLNTAANKDALLAKIYNNKPAFCHDYIKTENFISETKANLLDLKNHYACDLLTAGTGGFDFISHMTFSKLPNEVQNALINKLNTPFPNFTQIYDNYMEVINTIRRNKKKKAELKEKFVKYKTNISQGKSVVQTDNFAATATNVFKADNDTRRFHCRFCSADGHANSYCKVYASYKDRRSRCEELGLCSLCTLPNHSTDKCLGKSNKLKYPCKLCKSNKHCTAMCEKAYAAKQEQTNVCLSTDMENVSNYLMPIFRVQMKGHNGKLIKFNCLLDTASSRSYISTTISEQMGLVPQNVKNVIYNVKTFLGSGMKELQEASITAYLPSGRYMLRSILIDKDLNVALNVRGLNESILNIKDKDYNLAANYDEPILGLIGTDLIQFMKELKIVDCMHGSAFSIATGVIPFGDTHHFLYPGQVPIGKIKPAAQVATLNFKTIINEISVPSEKSINFCLQPNQSYGDYAAPFFEQATVERNIDNSNVVANLESMFSCESIGIVDENSPSNYDQEMIKKFEEGIEIKDNKIFVELMWNEKIKDVPSNHNVALKICQLVSDKLERKGALEEYNQIFLDQLTEGVIESFECSPDQFSKYIWLPHHPVYKEDQNSTFKTRPVFNASVKPDRTKPSLNEAAYVGVNMVQDLANLLMHFRTNKYTLLGDLRRAFLSIKLKLLKDKNRFCFFLRQGDQLKCYRYNII